MYSMVFDPPELDSFLMEKAITQAERQLNDHFMLFATTGQILMATNKIEEEVVVSSRVKQDFEVFIKISPSSCEERQLQDICADEGQINQALQQLVAIALRKGFTKNDMQQIGRAPSFFDLRKMVEIEVGRDGELLQLFPGLKATPWMYGNDLFISVDSCHKFIPKVTAYRAVMTLKDTWWRAQRKNFQGKSKDEIVEAFKDYVLETYDGQSIVTNYGNKKPYKISDFEPEVDLEGKTFERFVDGEKTEISIFEYFSGAYSFDLKYKVQPCFVCKFAGKKMFIPSEACSFEGIPSDVKKNKFAMKEVFKHCLISPQDRIQRSIEGVRNIMKSAEMSKWGLEIEVNPHQV